MIIGLLQVSWWLLLIAIGGLAAVTSVFFIIIVLVWALCLSVWVIGFVDDLLRWVSGLVSDLFRLSGLSRLFALLFRFSGLRHVFECIFWIFEAPIESPDKVRARLGYETLPQEAEEAEVVPEAIPVPEWKQRFDRFYLESI